jgi:hypothetical protein
VLPVTVEMTLPAQASSTRVVALFSLLALTLFFSVFGNNLIQAMDNGFYAACGGPPHQSCAIEYWECAASEVSGLVDSIEAMMNEPGFNSWCMHNPAACDELFQLYQDALQAHLHALYQLLGWL